MPRVANTADALLQDLIARLEKLVDTARKEGRDEALADVRNLVEGGGAPRGRGRKAAATTAAPAEKQTRKKSRKPRKNPWASMTPEQKKERVRKMLAGRGLKPKDDQAS